MNIGEALKRLCVIEMNVHVEVEGFDPWELLESYTHWLPGGNSTVNCPVAFHPGYRLVSTELKFGQRWRVYTVNQRILVAESASDADMKSELADAVHEAFADAFAANLMLGDGASLTRNLRTEDDSTVGRMEIEKGYVALSHAIDLILYDQPPIGVGE